MKPMTSMERVLAALQMKKPDRVPLFLLCSFYGARIRKMTTNEYFRQPSIVAETQLQFRDKFRTDSLYGFHYAAAELLAFGGEAVYPPDGPPNTVGPAFDLPNQLMKMPIPDVGNVPALVKALETLSLLKSHAKGDVPVVGVVMAPSSLAVMQLGFELFLQVALGDQTQYMDLLSYNAEFCVQWANAQFSAGADCICYFDPLASTDVLPRGLYLAAGLPIAHKVIGRLKGPTVTHLASGRALSTVADIQTTGTLAVGFSYHDDITKLRQTTSSGICLFGNWNAVEFATFKPGQAVVAIRKILQTSMGRGGFILSENHGEIPYQISEETLAEISSAVQEYGHYTSDEE